jgi:peptidyl-prolyl cis-trans isomerase SurA
MEATLKLSSWALPALLVAALATTAIAQKSATPAPPSGTTAHPTTPKPATAKPATAKPSSADSDRLDGIAAVVNDDVVLQSEVEEQLMNFLMQNHAQPDPAEQDTLRKQILDQLINEKLIVAEAKKQGLTATDAEVSKQVDAAIQQKKEQLGGEDAWAQQLKAENTTESAVRSRYKEQLKKEMIASRLMRKTLPPKTVSPTEAEAYFKAHPDKFPKRPPEVRLSVIQIPVSADSASEAEGRAKALEARKRIVQGRENFAKVAADASDDQTSARSGGDLGFFTRGAMESSLEQAAFTLKLNEVSQPIRTPYGWHILEVLDRDTVKTVAHTDSLDDKGVPLLEAHARHVLIRVPLSDDDVDRAKKLAEKVHAEAIKGADFGGLVKKYSKYQGKVTPEGDVGFVSLGSLQPQIREGLDSLAVGKVSEVLQNQIGFNIFKVTDKKPERDYQLEEIRAELPDAVAQIQFRERYDAWVKGLRAKAHIEVRGT